MEPDVEVRPATPDDARGIAEVYVASWRAAYTGLLPDEKMAQLDVDERERSWGERLEDLHALQLQAWVAVLNDHIVGFAFTQPSADEGLSGFIHELTALYLVPEVWRTGIGSDLLSAAEDSLRAAGIRESTLWVLEGNEGAKKFYEARGWKFDKRDASFRDFGAAALRYGRSCKQSKRRARNPKGPTAGGTTFTSWALVGCAEVFLRHQNKSATERRGATLTGQSA
jgi:GNAT superfamily N-acetyltransferase